MTKELSKYEVRGYVNDPETNGYDACQEADTLKEAKRIGKEMLTEEWGRHSFETDSNPLKHIEIIKTGRDEELIEEFHL